MFLIVYIHTLYSIDDRCKGLFAYTEAVPIVMQLILNFPQKLLAKELAALAINMSLNAKNAEMMSSQRGLQHLIDRVIQTKDVNVSISVRCYSMCIHVYMVCNFTTVLMIANALTRSMQYRCLLSYLVCIVLWHSNNQLMLLHDNSAQLIKTVRNISQWTYQLQASQASPEREYKYKYTLWSPLIEQLLDITVEPDTSHDILIEILGILCNMTQLDLPKGVTWCDVLSNYLLDAFLCKLLVPGMSQLDVVLEVIMLVGVIAHDTDAAKILATTNIVRALQNVLGNSSSSGSGSNSMDAHYDAEIQLQLMFTMWRLMMIKETREQVMYNTRAVTDMLEALESEHASIRHMADQCLDLVIEFDRLDTGHVGELGEQVKRQRFTMHNREWLQAIASTN
jgi:Kinesin-associated protein (KAP)